jgi:tol-pal system protein YbgF
MNKIDSSDIRRGFFRAVVLGLLFFCLGLGACATQQDVSVLQRQIWDARRELDKTKSQFAELEKAMEKKLEADRQPLRRNQAAVGAQLDQLELELGRLNGQLEEAAAMNEKNGSRISEIQQRQMESMLEIRKAVEDLQRGHNLMASSLGLQELVVNSTTGSTQEKKADKAQSGAAEVKTASKPSSSDAEGLYDKAFQLFRNGNFEAARAEFSSYLDRYPKTDLADNAQFWLGECYYSEKKYQQAIAAYEKTIKDYPKSDKVSSALLKQGMAFLELGDNTAGKILLKKVVKGYPQSNQAKIARNKLTRIK